MNTSEGGLNLLHEADDDALSWLKSAATAALAKEINRCSMGKIVYSNEERSGGSRIFAGGVRQLVSLECPKPLHALSPSDP